MLRPLHYPTNCNPIDLDPKKPEDMSINHKDWAASIVSKMTEEVSRPGSTSFGI